VKVTRHYADVPGAYSIRRPEVDLDLGPEPTPEKKREELRAIADAAERATQVLEEKPRKRVRGL
jgi:hypothetical protein